MTALTAVFRLKVAVVALAVAGLAGVTAAAASGGNRSMFMTGLDGYEEVPAVSTDGGGTFQAAISPSGDEIRYEVSWTALSGPPTQAHIHFGQDDVNGGITVFFCTNLGNGPADTQACPATGTGSVSGVITAADVVGLAAAQGIAAGEFDEVVRAVRAGKAYANVHTVKHPGGEVRGQIVDRNDD